MDATCHMPIHQRRLKDLTAAGRMTAVADHENGQIKA